MIADMSDVTCCFTGHRVIDKNNIQAVYTLLESKITKLIELGYINFCTGGAVGFDTISALSVLKVKQSFHNIKLVLILPCIDQTKGWSQDDIDIYEEIKTKADHIIYTSHEYVKGCMNRRNRCLVNMSSICISYQYKPNGGTAYTTKYATAHNLKLYNIYDEDQLH